MFGSLGGFSSHRKSKQEFKPNSCRLVRTLIGEKPVLAFLTVERRPIMDHLGMNFDLMNELHVVAKLLQIPDVTITDLADDKVILAASAGWRTGFEAAGFHTASTCPTAGYRGNRDARIIRPDSSSL